MKLADGEHDSGEGQVPPHKISIDQFEELMSLYSCRSRVEPGDAVGILAAQVSQCSILNEISLMGI